MGSRSQQNLEIVRVEKYKEARFRYTRFPMREREWKHCSR